jgi:hypothetical protein
LKQLDKDDEATRFWNDQRIAQKLESTIPLSQASFANYAAVFFPGGEPLKARARTLQRLFGATRRPFPPSPRAGHGPMFDLAVSRELGSALAAYWQSGGIIAAVSTPHSQRVGSGIARLGDGRASFRRHTTAALPQ